MCCTRCTVHDWEGGTEVQKGVAGAWSLQSVYPSLSSGLNPPSIHQFSLFICLLPYSSPFVIILPPVLLRRSLIGHLCHLPLFSLLIWKVLSKSTLCNNSCMVALAGCRPTLPSLALSPPLCWWAVTTQSAPPLHPNFSHSTIFFVVFPSALFFSSSRQGGYEVWDIACSNVRTHTCTLWGESGAVGLGASERGVSGNPSELVCEGLVNRTGEKKERRKEEWREKNKGGRMSWQGFQTSRSLIAGSVPLLPRTNAKMKGLLMNASHATSWHYCIIPPRRKMKRWW